MACIHLSIIYTRPIRTTTVLPAKGDSDGCFVYKVIMDLTSIDHLCINPILRLGLIHMYQSIRVSSSGVYKLMFYLTLVNKI